MLGDENNNDLIDLILHRPRECATVIDELGDPHRHSLEPVLLPAIQQTAKLTTAARAADMPVIFANDAHSPASIASWPWGAHGIAGTRRPRPSPLLDPQPLDYVVEKRRYSGFSRRAFSCFFERAGRRHPHLLRHGHEHLREAHGGRRVFQQLQYHRGRRRHGHLLVGNRRALST